MIKIYPCISITNCSLNCNQQNTKKYFADCNYDSVSFKGCAPSTSQNRRMINKIVKIVKLPEVEKIAIFLHRGPDLDAMGTGLGAKHLIEKVTGKKVDIFTFNPPDKKVRKLDSKKEVKVLKEILGSDVTESDITNKFGQYDAAISVDVANTSMFEDILYSTLFNNAKHKLKIDHHIAENNANSNYAHVNLTDTSKESAAQVLMEFITAFGLTKKDLTSEISTPLMTALASDSGGYMYIKSPKMFKDAAILSETADTEKIMRNLNACTIEELDDYIKILSGKKLAYNNKIAYFALGIEDKNVSGEAADKVRRELENVDSVKYVFTVKERVGYTKISVFSKDKPIIGILRELGGGGHDMAGGAKIYNMPSNGIINLLIAKLIKLDES